MNSEDLDLEVDLVIYLRTEPEKVRLTVKRFFFFFFLIRQVYIFFSSLHLIKRFVKSVGTPTNILH